MSELPVSPDELAESGKPIVVPLSLTDGSREKMQGLLDAYLQGDRSLTPGQIIEECLPPEILKTLLPLGAEERKDEAIVYSIENAPVMPPTAVVEGLVENPKLDEEKNWKKKCARENYVTVIVEGIFEKMKIRPANEPQLLVRYKKDVNWIEGGRPHQHEAPVAALGGLISNGALTRYIDWKGVMNEVQSNTELGKLNIRYQVKNPFSSAIETRAIKLQDAGGLYTRKVSINLCEGEDKAAFEALLDKHSCYLEAKPGTILLWRDDGTMLHEALEKTCRPEETEQKSGDVVRAAVARVGTIKPMSRPGLF